MRRFFMTLLHLFVFSAVSTAAFAGVTQVRFIEPDRFTDTHLNGEPVGDVLVELERLLIGLGQQCLLPGQTLEIEVLDVHYPHPADIPAH